MPNSATTARAEAIVGQLVTAGISVAATLPESWLGAVLDRVDLEPGIRHIRVAREDDGAAVCAGAALAGKRSVLICQNSGLLLSVNGLAGYALHHQLPFLALAVARGERDDGYFYQAYKGQVTEPVLNAVGMPYHRLTGDGDDHIIGEAMNQAWLYRRPVAVLCSRRSLLGEGDAYEAK
ncbi:thiamine pyrophosphate-binding protein [Nocardia sp. CA-290969]|uniref:thiamine pyrophosphate-binding protein n=1 Tax=Nocardia sp. CA-290969 TaxID=3239986 RepID=UPI003D94E675